MSVNYAEPTTREGSRADVQRRTLKDIVEKEGSVTPERLLELAKKKRHPLHQDFLWDDKIAGHKYRLKQATDMILAQRLIIEVLMEKDGTVKGVMKKAQKIHAEQARRYISVGRNRGYIPRPQAVEESEPRQHMIDSRIGDLRTWLRETADLEPELKKLRAAITRNLPKDN